MTRSAEHETQAAFIEWTAYRLGEYPELEWIFAIPNGGHRHKAVAGRMKAEGVRAGVPDLMLPVPRGGYHGLWIEVKIRPNKPTEAQTAWLEFLEGQGYAVSVCFGVEELIETVEWYLELEVTK